MDGKEVETMLVDHERRLTSLEAYLKLIAAEVPIGIAIVSILVIYFAHL